MQHTELLGKFNQEPVLRQQHLGFSFVNYLRELPDFRQQVLQFLHRRGRRESAPGG